MTYPQTPAPAPPPGPPPPPGPGQAQAPVPQDQPQAPAPAVQDQPQDQGGQSATDAAGDDIMAWQAAAEADARFETVDRPMLQSGQVG